MSTRVLAHDPRGPTYQAWHLYCRHCGQEMLAPAKLDRCAHCWRGPLEGRLTGLTTTFGQLLRFGKEKMKKRPNQAGTGWTTNDPDFAFDDRIRRQTVKQMEILQNRGYGKGGYR